MNKFEERYKSLNKAQKEAVDTIEGPVMVIAGPGTGKTTILTLRTANILKKTDTPPDAILALTFTEAGVRAMRRKLSGLIGPEAYKIRLYTFHSFCNDVIKMYPDKFPRIIGAEHVEDLEQMRIVETLINEGNFKLLRPKGDPTYYVRKIISAIKDLKRDDINPDNFEVKIKEQEKEILKSSDLKHEKGPYKGKIKGEYAKQLEYIEKNKELAKAYKAYEEALENHRLYDFEDMIIEVVRLFESDEDFRLRIEEEYHYILADEHQDANNAQNKLLELLSSFHENPNLFIVGDEKQAIFRFQGASLENFLYFKKKFPKAKVIKLKENYRSNQTILDAAHSLALHNKVEDETLRETLVSKAERESRKINIVSLRDKDGELSFITNEIEKLIKNGVPPKEIAVFIRNNRDAEAIERVLSTKGIVVARFADADALEHPYIDSLLNFLKAILSPSEDELLGKVLFSSFLGIDTVVASRTISEARKSHTPIIDYIQHNKETKDFYNKLKHFSSIAHNEPLVDAFDEIVKESGFLKFIITHNRSHELISLYDALLKTVVRHAERNKKATLADFMERLVKAEELGTSIATLGIPPDGVNLMTAHGSKGLEFDYVFIVHAEDGVWGGRRQGRSFHLPTGSTGEDTTEDERRLFYVALTRARIEANITYHEFDAEGKEMSPSQFIYEIDEAHRNHIVSKNGKAEISATPLKKRQPLIKDKDFIKKLFLERGLAVTHINNYLDCPWRYFFVDLIRVPKKQENPLLYGSAIHSALKHYFDAYKREEEISVAKAVELFEDYLGRTHMRDEDLKEHLEVGKESLEKYLESSKFNRNIWNEYKVSGVPFKVGSDEVILNGNLDKIELLRDGVVNVVDYKTGKPKSRNEIEGKTKNADGNYMRQLVFYKLLLDRYKKGEWQMETGTIDFVEPDDKEKMHREVFSISNEEVKDLEKVIQNVAKEIISMSFVDRTCGDKDCEWCRLAESLPARNA